MEAEEARVAEGTCIEEVAVEPDGVILQAPRVHTDLLAEITEAYDRGDGGEFAAMMAARMGAYITSDGQVCRIPAPPPCPPQGWGQWQKEQDERWRPRGRTKVNS